MESIMRTIGPSEFRNFDFRLWILRKRLGHEVTRKLGDIKN